MDRRPEAAAAEARAKAEENGKEDENMQLKAEKEILLQDFAKMNNTNQMIKSFHLYAGDEEDLIPPNHDDGNSIPWRNWCSGQASASSPSIRPGIARRVRRGPAGPPNR